MAKPFAYVCAACEHLTSRHNLHLGGVSSHGLYSCRFEGCGCQIFQHSSMYGIDEATFNRVHLPTLGAYATWRIVND